MPDNLFLSLLFNIGFLIFLAFILTRIPTVRNMLTCENLSIPGQLLTAALFGFVSILATYTGIETGGAIVNTRVIGVLSAGLLGGPVIGIGAALIGGIHRYFYEAGQLTAAACAVSTMAEGVIGVVCSKYFHRGKWDNGMLFLLTAVTEVCQMLLILLIARPFSAALDVVKEIALPMIILNSCGMVVFIGTFRALSMEKDNEKISGISLALHVASQCLPHLRKGLDNPADIKAAADIIFQSTTCSAVMITDREHVLAFSCSPGNRDFTAVDNLFNTPIRTAMEQHKTICVSEVSSSDPLAPVIKNYVLTAVPLTSRSQVSGCLCLFYKKRWHRTQSRIVFAENLSALFSTQLELADLNYEKSLRRKAEIRALRSQVNPHFLHNALNTISCMCRENPERARELSRTLSVYYRQTLEPHHEMTDLHTELYQVLRYLEMEKARFEENLQIETDVPEQLNCLIPSFILQPLVENAVRYGADGSGLRTVAIRARQTPDGIKIEVADHGPGIPEAITEAILSGREPGKSYGLYNVHTRLKKIIGPAGGLAIQHIDGETRVSFLIPNADTVHRAEDWQPSEEIDTNEVRGEYG